MHWTILTLWVLCAACLLLNAAQFAMLRTVRTAGVLICLGWAIQQGWWMANGDDSLALFIACDTAIIGWFLWRLWHRRRFDMAERLIAATIPLTTALGIFAEIHGGHTVLSWWANWWLVAGQMAIGLPFLPVAAFWRRTRLINRIFDPWEHFKRQEHKA